MCENEDLSVFSGEVQYYLFFGYRWSTITLMRYTVVQNICGHFLWYC